jgi:hypothetical protein
MFDYSRPSAGEPVGVVLNVKKFEVLTREGCRDFEIRLSAVPQEYGVLGLGYFRDLQNSKMSKLFNHQIRTGAEVNLRHRKEGLV